MVCGMHIGNFLTCLLLDMKPLRVKSVMEKTGLEGRYPNFSAIE